MKIFDIEINDDNFNKIDFSLLLLTLYFRNMKVKFGKENTTINVLILRETFKTSNDYIRANQIMNENFDELMSLVNTNNYERLFIGKILRKIHYKNIIKILLASICYEYLDKVNLNTLISEVDDNILKQIIYKYKFFFNYLIKENMLHIDELKPLFSGQDIIKMLNIKPGKEIGILLELLINEQLKNPNFTKEDAIDFLNKEKDEIASNFSNQNDNSNKSSNKKKKKKDN